MASPSEESADTDLRIVVTGLVLDCVIGVYPGERDRSQRLRFDLELETDPPAAFDDDFAQVVDYGAVVERVKGVVAGNDRHLLETLADRILQACFEDAPVRHAAVTIRKLDLDPAAEGIGIRLARGRSR